MISSCQIHKNYILSELFKSHTQREWEYIFKFHKFTIRNLQHERLIHLLITLTVGLSLLATGVFMITYTVYMLYPVAALLLTLFVPYIIHYFRLENGVQELYKLNKDLEEKILK